MKRLLVLLLTLAASSNAAQAAENPSQTAFFCMLAKVDAGGAPVGRPVRLNVLLSGHPADALPPAAVATYDPANLLESAKFSLFFPGPASAPVYVILTGAMTNRSAFLLSLTPRDGKPGQYQATLGRRGAEPTVLGQCFGPVGPITETEFLEDSAKGEVK